MEERLTKKVTICKALDANKLTEFNELTEAENGANYFKDSKVVLKMLHAKQKQDVEKRTIQKNGVSPLNLGAANE